MTPNDFIAKWRSGGDERRDWHSFFDDLCRLVGHKTPREADPAHTWFTYEYGVGKAGGGEGWADAWKKNHFGWEAKGTGKDLIKAYAQLKMYSDDLQNPPLLVVCDLRSFEVHTNFTNSVKEVHRFTVEDLATPEVRRILEAVFKNPEALRPGVTKSGITEAAASKFADLAWALRSRGHDPHTVAHFLNRLVFCMFAEDIGLLQNHLFTKMVEGSQDDPDAFEANARQLFAAMRQGGQAGFTRVDWFNGGLFDHDQALRLEAGELRTLLEACQLEWDQIDPSIFGTLFERGLDPEKRAQLGAHYTDPATIMRIIRPVIIEPWLTAWEAEKDTLRPLVEKADIFGSRKGETPAQKGVRTKALSEANDRVLKFLERLRAFTVLDPACGSGNFLFMSLRALKDIEQRVMVEAEEMALNRHFPGVNPQAVKGIELNEYAAELARITVWIGEVQWMIQNGYGVRKNPILQSLNQIENRDSLLDDDGRKAEWPAADVIVGNPPFIGNKKMIGELGEDYVRTLRKAYEGQVSGEADFVCFWFDKSDTAIRKGETQRTGLVATNSIRGGANREVLKEVLTYTRIFDAWSDEGWWDRGTAVRVSMICFGDSNQQSRLDGNDVVQIFADLTADNGVEGVDITDAKVLASNSSKSFQGTTKGGAFDIPGEIARQWLPLPNPNGKPNAEVVRPWSNGMDVVRRPSDTWCIDFGTRMDEAAASLYEAPFQYALKNVKPVRDLARRDGYRLNWWRHAESRSGMREALKGLDRFIATPRVSKHRLFTWLDKVVLPDTALVVIARDDDTSFGVLQSRIHEVWSLRQGTALGVGNDPRYTPGSCFETFPFPKGLEPDVPASKYATDSRAQRIAADARDLIERRAQWLNPTEWTERAPEVVGGHPERVTAKKGHEKDLAKRTLTNLYNEKPAWLALLHERLDEAVAAAYGWEWPLSENEILRRLLELNRSR